MEVEGRNPKQGLVPLGKTAKPEKDLPAACSIFKKEVVRIFFFVSVHFVGLITDTLSSNICMNKWTRMFNANR